MVGSGARSQAPKWRRASASACGTVRSPTSTSVALLGRYQLPQKVATSSRVMASTVSRLPLALRPKGWSSPNTSAVKPRSANAGPRSCSCSSAASRSCLRRSKSFWAKVGRSATSAINASALSRVAVVVCSVTVPCSKLAPVRSPMARNAAWSAMARASRPPAPSSSMMAVRVASPILAAGSASGPVRTTSTASSTGSSWCSTMTSRRPLGRVRSTICGSASRRTGPSAGGVGLAALAVACAPSAGAQARSARAARRRLVRVGRISGTLRR